ncbi:MAG: bifunctional metallophosphatase/5'-nucleotidase [Candidatus Brocadia sp.]|nr:bifunctional metallophosphatase/5'-nucleotidase [Candidatus Brocadia sp.]
MTIRQAFRCTILFAIVVFGVRCSAFSEIKTGKDKTEHEVKFKILQINDVYKIEGLERGTIGGIARVRTLRKELEREGQPVLVLLAGDFLFPSVMSKYFHARPMVDMLNLLDGDPSGFDPHLIVTFGNHEFEDSDPGIILGRIAQSDFRWVASNIRYCSAKADAGLPFSHRLYNVHDTILLDVGGAPVGIFGLTIDSQQQDYVTYDYELPVRYDAVKKAIDTLKGQGARMIIALTHQDMEEDENLASFFPEIDIIVGGHDHSYLKEQIGHTWITKADADARSAIVYDVRIPLDAPVGTIPQKVDLDSKKPDEEVKKEVDKRVDKLLEVIKEQNTCDPQKPIGHTKYKLEGVETAVRKRETALGNFLTDVIRDKMETDIAFINGGGIRINDDIPANGTVTVYDMEGIFYYNNELVAFELTGKELLDILNISVQNVDKGDGRFLQVSGIKFRYHNGGTQEKPVYKVNQEDVTIKRWGESIYTPLTLDKTSYTVGSVNYLWEKGFKDGYTIFSQGDKDNKGTSPKRIYLDKSISFRKATEEAIAKKDGKMITTDIEGRITPP